MLNLQKPFFPDFFYAPTAEYFEHVAIGEVYVWFTYQGTRMVMSTAAWRRLVTRRVVIPAIAETSEQVN